MRERLQSRRLLLGAIAAAIVAVLLLGVSEKDEEPAAGPAQTPAAAVPEPEPEAAPAQRLWAGEGHPLAQVRRERRVRIHAEPDGPVLAVARDRTIFGSPSVFGVQRRRGNWLRVSSQHTDSNEPAWIRADPERLRFRESPFSIHVDLGAREVELRRGEESLLRFPVTIGSEDARTPTGQFAITDVITRNLDPVYGCCALALSARQPDLPDDWIGGDLVAIHGSTGPVGSASSLGCIRAADEHVGSLAPIVPLGTPVLISD